MNFAYSNSENDNEAGTQNHLKRGVMTSQIQHKVRTHIENFIHCRPCDYHQ